MHRILIVIAFLLYLLMIAYFVFRPFREIPAHSYKPVSLAWDNEGVHIQPGAALEDRRRNVLRMRKSLMKSGQMSLHVILKTDSLQQSGPANIVTFSRDITSRNFMLAQQGNAVEFRLRAMQNYRTWRSNLLVPMVLDTNRTQQLTVTYDGLKTKLYVDGEFRAESSELKGGFADWGRNHALVVGDEPPGGRAWSGEVRYFAIYDRALDSNTVVRLSEGQAIPGAVLVHDFQSVRKTRDASFDGMVRLRYRNLFITTDPAAYVLTDCIFNIIGFMPMGILVYFALPLRLRRRKMIAAIVVPSTIGFAVSGSIEWSQCFIESRVPCVLDVCYNVVGTLMGSLMAWLACSSFGRTTAKGWNG